MITNYYGSEIKGMRWFGYLGHIDKIWSEYTLLVAKLYGSRLFGRQEYNVKMDILETRMYVLDWKRIWSDGRPLCMW